MGAERPYIQTPSDWNRDLVLNSVSWEAEFLFRRIASDVSRYWRISVDPGNIEHSIRCKAFEPSRRHAAWSLPKIAHYLSELLGKGIVRRLDHEGRCWIEVGDWLQYSKGARSPEEGPPGPGEQAELRLGPMDCGDGKEPMAHGRGGLPRASRRIAAKGDSKEMKSTDSLARMAGLTDGREHPDGPEVGGESGNRGLSALGGIGEPASPEADLGKHAVALEWFNQDPLGKRLVRFVGAAWFSVEAQRSGREWMRVLKEEAAGLEDLLEQGERVRSTMPEGQTRAKFLTKRLGERRAA